MSRGCQRNHKTPRDEDARGGDAEKCPLEMVLRFFFHCSPRSVNACTRSDLLFCSFRSRLGADGARSFSSVLASLSLRWHVGGREARIRVHGERSMITATQQTRTTVGAMKCLRIVTRVSERLVNLTNERNWRTQRGERREIVETNGKNMAGLQTVSTTQCLYVLR